jgi:hypothetical protein
MNKKITPRNLAKHPIFFLVLIVSFFVSGCDSSFPPPVTTIVRVDQVEIPDVHPDESSVIKILSLKKFMEACKKDPGNQDVLNMYGLQRIEGYITDRENNDILIFAKEVENWPSTTLSDFIESLRNAVDSTTPPKCSLDPTVDGLNALNEYWDTVDKDKFDTEYAAQQLGKQTCFISGVSPKSHFASVMLDADYHMKKVSQGVVKLDSVKSALDYVDESNYSEASGMSRFWFKLDDKYPYYEESENLLRISKLPIQVLTQTTGIDENGQIVDVPGNNPIFNNFALDFSSHFKKSSQVVECYAGLDNIYHLQAITDALQKKELISNYDTIFQYFRQSFTIKPIDYPEGLDGIVSFKKLNFLDGSWLTLIISGGVELNSTFSPDKMQHTNSDFINVETIDFLKQVNKEEKKPFIIFDMKAKKYQVNNILPFFNKELRTRFLNCSDYLTDFENVA